MSHKKSNITAIETIKAMSGVSNSISIQRPYIRACGGNYAQAAVLTQLVFWSGIKAGDWFYKSNEQLAGELEISISQLRYALSAIKKNMPDVIFTCVKKVNGTPTKHYRIDGEALLKILLPESKKEPQKEQKNKGKKEGEILANRNADISKSECCDQQVLGNADISKSFSIRSNNRSNIQIIGEIKRSKVPIEQVPENLNQAAWSEWLSYKNLIKSNYKTTNGELVKMRELVELSAGDSDLQSKIVAQSVNNEWKGLFALKTSTGGGFNRQAQIEANNAKAMNDFVSGNFNNPFEINQPSAGNTFEHEDS